MRLTGGSAVAHAAERRVERLAMGGPAVLALGAGTRGAPSRARSAGSRSVAIASASASGLARIVEQRLAIVRRERGNPRQRRRDHRQPGRHVLEDLERRPVEAEGERAVSGDVEGRDADVGRGQTRRHDVVRHRAGERDVREARGIRPDAGQLGSVADEDRRDVVLAARTAAASSRPRGRRRRASCGRRPRRPPASRAAG